MLVMRGRVRWLKGVMVGCGHSLLEGHVGVGRGWEGGD